MSGQPDRRRDAEPGRRVSGYALRQQTVPETPAALGLRMEAMQDFCVCHAVPNELRRLLAWVVNGERGPSLRHVLDVDEGELQTLHRAFEAATGMGVYEAAVQVLTTAAARRA